MSLHSSLKTTSGALNQHRNVLTRAERIARLTDEGRFTEGETSPLGIVKVRSIKIVTAKKKKAAELGEDGEGEVGVGSEISAAGAGAPAS
jgi:small basic protein (TIGR04137 family)